MGLEQHSEYPHLWRDAKITNSPFVALHEYSTDIAAAWEVVNKSQSFQVKFNELGSGVHEAIVCFNNEDGSGFEQSKTAPHAICLAALKSIGKWAHP